MCIYIYTYTHIYTYTFTHTRIYTHTHVYTRSRIYTQMYTLLYTHIYTHAFLSFFLSFFPSFFLAGCVWYHFEIFRQNRGCVAPGTTVKQLGRCKNPPPPPPHPRRPSQEGPYWILDLVNLPSFEVTRVLSNEGSYRQIDIDMYIELRCRTDRQIDRLRCTTLAH